MPTQIGQRYGKLTAIKQTLAKKGITKWEAKCDCGETIEIAGRLLTQGRATSCGCEPEVYCGTKLKPGVKINRLTTVSYSSGKWKCLCDCGEYTNVITNNIINGNTKSCGCLHSEVSRKVVKYVHEGNRKLEPKIATAKRRWETYNRVNDPYLSFDDFLNLSSKNCTYCGIEPLQCWNAFSRKNNASQYSRDNGDWYYNGIDRINSEIGYVIENCRTACFQCNNAKSDQLLQCFLDRIPKYMIQLFAPMIWDETIIPKGSLRLSIWMAYKDHFDDGDISLENFYWASSLPCFYCNEYKLGGLNFASYDKKSSQKAKNEGMFYYNGLDRIDPNKGHTRDNVVPCCKYCNWAKLDQSLEDFQNWIRRIQAYQLEHPFIIPTLT